ncbi:hypothetical protein Tco_1094958 [Tanacetum coccineum]
MVAYLKKPSGSEGFQEIVDFLNESHIRLLLSEHFDNGEQEITAIVDGKEFTITEASVRRHLQLADVDGISVLPTTKIFAQLSLMGYVLTDDKLTFQKGKIYGAAYTKLIMKVKKLEKTVKTSQARRRAKIVVSDDEI